MNVSYVEGIRARAKFPIQPSPTGMKGNLALCMGVGTLAAPEVSATDSAKFFSSYLQNSATSGTSVGEYMKLTITGVAGSGVCHREYAYGNVVMSLLVGAQITAETGAAGKVTGLLCGVRSQTMLADDATVAPAGTITGGQSELYFNGDNSSTTNIAGATHSIHRFIVDGDTTARAKVQNAFEFVNIKSGTAATDMIKTDMHTAAPTDGLRTVVNGAVYYICLVAG